eukprot:TRINITY_DN2091_c0_g1_i1.p1 TRINITY_DN2091_c0_g1~~TRINITY_DN2091_c0_g1_i1.p1  ORF type:complete len:298 (+),score=124.14 TRINITY_DN2091_c0_g1_i1:75-968(+)
MLVARNVFQSLARTQQTKTALTGAIAQYTTAKGHHYEEPVKPPCPTKFEVYRWNGEAKPYLQVFEIDTADSPMILDALLKIKNTIDPTLSFRRSCREGICGSCAMNIGGTNTLACLCTMDKVITGPNQTIRIYPLPHQPVVRDLVPDLSAFYRHHKFVEPWLHLTPEQEAQPREMLQSPEDRKKLDGLYECILCACCSTSCPSYWWHGQEDYLGPAVLLQMFRWVSDSRDQAKSQRLALLEHSHHTIFACHSILNCTLACPKHLNPARAIAKLKNMMLTERVKVPGFLNMFLDSVPV